MYMCVYVYKYEITNVYTYLIYYKNIIDYKRFFSTLIFAATTANGKTMPETLSF